MKCWKCGALMLLDDGEPFCLTCGNRNTSPPVRAVGSLTGKGPRHRGPGKGMRVDAGRRGQPKGALNNKIKEVMT